MNSVDKENFSLPDVKREGCSLDSNLRSTSAAYSTAGAESSYQDPRGEIIHEASSDGSTVIIRIDGRFDFSLHDAFRRAYRNTWRFGVRYVLDMRATTCMDSSALGMLLLMREYIGSSSEPIRVLGCSPEIQKAFQRARFEQFFQFR